MSLKCGIIGITNIGKTTIFNCFSNTKAEASKAVTKHVKSMHKMAKGGVTRADGAVMKGHTKGKMIAMCGGGMTKRKK